MDSRNRPEKVVILTDSLSAIQSIDSGKSNIRQDILDQILYLIHCTIQDHILLQIDWCPSHCNIEGNEEADQAAKNALTNGKALNFLPTPQEIYQIIKEKIKTEWSVDWKNYRGFRHDIDPDLPVKRTLYSENRQNDRIFTRLRMGVNGLNSNNVKHNEANPICPHCDNIEDTDHYFLHCTAHTNARENLITALKKRHTPEAWILKKMLTTKSQEIRDAVFQYIEGTNYKTRI